MRRKVIVLSIKQMEGEEWRPVVGFPGYEVSNLGNVKSLDRRVALKAGGTRFRKGTDLKFMYGRFGYREVEMYREFKRYRVRVHRVVAEAFLSNPKNHPIVRHKDDVHTDNRVENLAWGTQSENMFDAWRNGGREGRVEPHCKNGHPFTEDSLYIHPKGYKICRVCHREANQRYTARKRGEINEETKKRSTGPEVKKGLKLYR